MKGGDSARAWLTGAADDQQKRTLAVLLLDASGSGGVGIANRISW
jgi:hypothetical protein